MVGTNRNKYRKINTIHLRPSNNGALAKTSRTNTTQPSRKKREESGQD